MCKSDPLLKAISQDASRDSSHRFPQEDGPRVSVLIGGVLLTGYVFAPGAFVDEALPEDWAAEWRQQSDDETAEYLHLHTDEKGQGMAEASKMNVRIPLDRIDAWWTAAPHPKR